MLPPTSAEIKGGDGRAVVKKPSVPSSPLRSAPPFSPADAARPIVIKDQPSFPQPHASHRLSARQDNPLMPDTTHKTSLLPQPSPAPPPNTVQTHAPAIRKDRPSPLSQPSPKSHLLPADIVFADYLLRSNRQMIPSSFGVQHPRWQDWTWSQLRVPEFQALDPEGQNDAGDKELQFQSCNEPAVSLCLV